MSLYVQLTTSQKYPDSLESSMEIIFQSSDASSEAKVQAVFPQ